MRLTELTGQNGNGNRILHIEFAPKLTVVTAPKALPVFAALCLLFDYHVPETLLPSCSVPGEYTSLSATVTSTDGEFRIAANLRESAWSVGIMQPDGRWRNGFPMRHCAEEDTANIYIAGVTDFSDRLYRYKCAGDYYPANTFSVQTDGIGATRNFRTYLHRYAAGSASETFRKETEVYQQFCFLQTAEFWSELERERNMHYEPKPLLLLYPQIEKMPADEIRHLEEQLFRMDRQAVLFLPGIK